MFSHFSQDLQYLELESERDPERVQVSRLSAHTPSTPFSILAAQQSNTAVSKAEARLHDQFGTKAQAAVREVSAVTRLSLSGNYVCVALLDSIQFCVKQLWNLFK